MIFFRLFLLFFRCVFRVLLLVFIIALITLIYGPFLRAISAIRYRKIKKLKKKQADKYALAFFVRWITNSFDFRGRERMRKMKEMMECDVHYVLDVRFSDIWLMYDFVFLHQRPNNRSRATKMMCLIAKVCECMCAWLCVCAWNKKNIFMKKKKSFIFLFSTL